MGDQRASERDPLLLAAGQLARPPRSTAIRSDSVSASSWSWVT